MKINTALILCAGYGERLKPLTLTEPKPLLKINEITLLENCINLIQSLRIEKVIINTFYLKEKIESFVEIKKFATIDTQDALIGNRAYDLASLIDDVRFKSNKELKDNVYNYYLKLNKNKINKVNLLNDFEILSVIRNMKIIGIFVRLAVRDKKNKYLKLIPYAWKLIELRIKNNQIFDGLKRTLDQNFSKDTRNLK